MACVLVSVVVAAASSGSERGAGCVSLRRCFASGGRQRNRRPHHRRHAGVRADLARCVRMCLFGGGSEGVDLSL